MLSGDLRHHGLPGAGDADRAGPGRLQLGGADLLRRAMGKKKAEEMAEHREIFRAGRGRRTASREEKADEIFDLMEKFAGYGFNKSHAAAYSLLAYHTGWLKVHYTAEFFCANMTVEMDDTDKLKVLFEDARRTSACASSRRMSTGAATASSRCPTRSSATDWARSRARASRPSRPSHGR
jgi:hypothetical protein